MKNKYAQEMARKSWESRTRGMSPKQITKMMSDMSKLKNTKKLTKTQK